MNWVFLVPVAAIIGGCMIGAVAVWSENRRREREEYHRNETYQKMLDGSAETAETVRQLIQEEESRRERRRLDGQALGLKMGGLITTAAGVGLGVFLYFMVPDEPVWLVGLIPLLIGPVLTYFGVHVGAQAEASGRG